MCGGRGRCARGAGGTVSGSVGRAALVLVVSYAFVVSAFLAKTSTLGRAERRGLLIVSRRRNPGNTRQSELLSKPMRC